METGPEAGDALGAYILEEEMNLWDRNSETCEKASFCVWNEGFRKEGDWALNITSVIVFGRIHIVEDRDRNIEIARKIALKYYPDAEGAEEEVRKAGNRVTCLEMQVEHMTGKLVNES